MITLPRPLRDTPSTGSCYRKAVPGPTQRLLIRRVIRYTRPYHGRHLDEAERSSCHPGLQRHLYKDKDTIRTDTDNGSLSLSPPTSTSIVRSGRQQVAHVYTVSSSQDKIRVRATLAKTLLACTRALWRGGVTTTNITCSKDGVMRLTLSRRHKEYCDAADTNLPQSRKKIINKIK